MILTLTTFEKGTLKLPNVLAEPNGADNRADIQSYIDQYEREILIKGLGPALYQIVKDNYTGEILNEAAPIEVKDLVQGKTYEVDGLQVTWEGLTPLLGNYVFYKFWVQMEHVKRDNDENISTPPKALNAYREFHKKYQGEDPGPRYVYNASGSRGIDWYGSRSADRSLLQYLMDNADTYPDAVLEPVPGMNSMGI